MEPITRALLVVAHPDDAEFWAGGTVARWAAEGVEVSYLVLTDGDAGGSEQHINRAALTEERRREQRAAADLLSVGHVDFLGWSEGTFGQGLERRKDVARVVRRVRPHRVVTWTPEWNWTRFRSSCHVDHRATGEITLTAVYPDAQNPHAHPELLRDEGLEPWTVSEIWLINGRETNTYVDVTDYFEAKVRALEVHSTQAQGGELVEKMKTWFASIAEGAGMEEGRFAEAFQRIENR